MTHLLRISSSGDYINPEAVAALTPGSPGKDKGADWTFVAFIGGNTGWYKIDSEILAQRIMGVRQ